MAEQNDEKVTRKNCGSNTVVKFGSCKGVAE